MKGRFSWVPLVCLMAVGFSAGAAGYGIGKVEGHRDIAENICPELFK